MSQNEGECGEAGFHFHSYSLVGEKIGRQSAIWIKILKDVWVLGPFASLSRNRFSGSNHMMSYLITANFYWLLKMSQAPCSVLYIYFFRLRLRTVQRGMFLQLLSPETDGETRHGRVLYKYVQASMLHGYLGFGPTSEPRALPLH